MLVRFSFCFILIDITMEIHLHVVVWFAVNCIIFPWINEISGVVIYIMWTGNEMVIIDYLSPRMKEFWRLLQNLVLWILRKKNAKSRTQSPLWEFGLSCWFSLSTARVHVCFGKRHLTKSVDNWWALFIFVLILILWWNDSVKMVQFCHLKLLPYWYIVEASTNWQTQYFLVLSITCVS